MLSSRLRAADIEKGNTDAQACWAQAKRDGVHVEKEGFLRAYSDARQATETQRSICESLARRTRVFFLWYEDMLYDFARTLVELQAFLGVPPRRLTTELVKISGDSYAFVTNLDELTAATRRLDSTAMR